MKKEQKKVFTVEFEKPVKLVGFGDEGLLFSDETKVMDYHDQDCCESVYADWKQLDDTGILEDTFKELVITGNPELGIVLNGTYGIPCYNEQNGYYSDDLSIIVEQPGRPSIEIDISNFVEDVIY